MPFKSKAQQAYLYANEPKVAKEFAKKTSKKAMKKRMTEDSLQIAVARLLDHTGLHWFHCPNGGKRNILVAAKLKRMGTKAGVPDVMIVTPTIGHCGVAIELKSDSGRLTDTQKQWREALTSCGWAYYTARSVDEVIEICKTHYPKYVK